MQKHHSENLQNNFQKKKHNLKKKKHDFLKQKDAENLHIQLTRLFLFFRPV